VVIGAGNAQDGEIDLSDLDTLVGARWSVDDNRLHSLEWPNGDWMKFQIYSHEIYVNYLYSQQPGRLTQVVSTLPAFFRERGIGVATTTLSGPGSRRWLEGVGLVERANGVFACSLEENCRFDEYAAWKRNEIAEPGWHKNIAEDSSRSGS
jgi:hypothetical protein